MFSITLSGLHWLDGTEEKNDLCLHGKAAAIIGNERFEYDATVSSTALYLLKSLTEDHRTADANNQMLPCCGFFMIPDETLTSVEICGCPNGIDWSVIHDSDGVTLITEAGNKTFVPMDEYRTAVFAFADQIEAFYESSAEKELPKDEYERKGYAAFWNEWKRRRYDL